MPLRGVGKLEIDALSAMLSESAKMLFRAHVDQAAASGEQRRTRLAVYRRGGNDSESPEKDRPRMFGSHKGLADGIENAIPFPINGKVVR